MLACNVSLLTQCNAKKILWMITITLDDKNNGKNEDDKSEEILKENEKTTTGDNEVLASKKLASIQNSCKYGGSLLSEITYIN